MDLNKTINVNKTNYKIIILSENDQNEESKNH